VEAIYTKDTCRSDSCPGNFTAVGIFATGTKEAGLEIAGIVSESGLNSTVFFRGVFLLVISGIFAEAVVFNN
jgi:hypothetical protein